MRVLDASAADSELILLSADGQGTSLEAVTAVLGRLGNTPGIHIETGRGVLDNADRLSIRTNAVAALLPSTTLAYMRQSGLPDSAAFALRSIARLGIDPLHVLARAGIGRLADLAGQKVNLGPRDSATQASAAVLLERAGVKVDALYLDHEQARQAVLGGGIAAMMLLAPRPVRLFSDAALSSGVHFLPVTPPAGRPEAFVPTQIFPGDYKLPAAGTVPAAGVTRVMACFNWAAGTPMFAALTRLARLMGERGFDVAADVPGWQHFPPLASRPARMPDKTADQGRPLPPDASLGQKEELFQEFLNWRRTH